MTLSQGGNCAHFGCQQFFSVSFGMKTSLAGVGSLKYLEEICVDIATFYENANSVM